MPSNCILIVDDGADERQIAGDVLLHAGYTILEAATAEDGFALACKERPGAILMDLEMPGTDGFAAIDQLRSDADASAIPVIIYTGFEDVYEDRLSDLDPQPFVVHKPITPTELLEAVAKALGRASG